MVTHAVTLAPYRAKSSPKNPDGWKAMNVKVGVPPLNMARGAFSTDSLVRNGKVFIMLAVSPGPTLCGSLSP